MHKSSSYAKILGETNFRTQEIPRSGSKAKEGEKRRRRLNDGKNNGQATHGAWATVTSHETQELLNSVL